MAHFYADSSALVKRHLPELGSLWIRHLTDRRTGHVISTNRLSLVEVISAFNRRVRDGSLSATDYIVARGDFLARCRRLYRLNPITTTLINRTRDLLEHHPLRTYDALHLASALLTNDRLAETGLPALTFLAADDRLLVAAQFEGLSTDNPNRY